MKRRNFFKGALFASVLSLTSPSVVLSQDKPKVTKTYNQVVQENPYYMILYKYSRQTSYDSRCKVWFSSSMQINAESDEVEMNVLWEPPNQKIIFKNRYIVHKETAENDINQAMSHFFDDVMTTLINKL